MGRGVFSQRTGRLSAFLGQAPIDRDAPHATVACIGDQVRELALAEEQRIAAPSQIAVAKNVPIVGKAIAAALSGRYGTHACSS